MIIVIIVLIKIIIIASTSYTKRGPNFKFEEQRIKILNSGATEEVAGR